MMIESSSLDEMSMVPSVEKSMQFILSVLSLNTFATRKDFTTGSMSFIFCSSMIVSEGGNLLISLVGKIAKGGNFFESDWDRNGSESRYSASCG